MNNKNFNQLKSFLNSSKGSTGQKGLIPIVLGLGLLWLANQSIYYGKFNFYF